MFGLGVRALKDNPVPLAQLDPCHQRVLLGWAERYIGSRFLEGVRFKQLKIVVGVLALSDGPLDGGRRTFEQGIDHRLWKFERLASNESELIIAILQTSKHRREKERHDFLGHVFGDVVRLLSEVFKGRRVIWDIQLHWSVNDVKIGFCVSKATFQIEAPLRTDGTMQSASTTVICIKFMGSE
jgi:hypothetical protein